MPNTPTSRRPSPTRRRIDTRERLLDAAFTVFVAKGFGRTRIDDICREAGYTKGAFYSNFSSLEELFFALYDRQSAVGMDFTLESLGDESFESISAFVTTWTNSVVIDRNWLLINVDFVSFAARYPDIAAELATHRRELRDRVVDRLAQFIESAGLDLPESLPTPFTLARAIETVFDGVLYQLLLDMDEAAVRRHLREILLGFVRPR